MNRYQREVAAMDRRYRLIVRTISFLGAGIIVFAALWSAGLPQWLSLMNRRSESDAPSVSASSNDGNDSRSAPPPPVAPEPPTSQELLQSTASSVAPVPQPLFLISTTPGRNKNEGIALIGTDARSPQTYVGGAILANGARLTEIHSDHVILRRGDSTLRLNVSSDRAVLLRQRANGNHELGMIGAVALQRPLASRPEPGHISDVVRSMPHYENDLLTGIQLFPGKKSFAFSALGLSAGDVLTSIDGAPVLDPDTASAALAALAQGAAMVATVQRHGKTMTLTLDGSIVTAALAPPQQHASADSETGPPPM